MESKMVFTVVGRNSGEKVVAAAKKAGARGGTIVPCRFSSDNGVLQLLGIGESDKDAVLILVDGNLSDSIMSMIIQVSDEDKKLAGFTMMLDISSVVKYVVDDKKMCIIRTGEEKMSGQTSHELISVIVNSGFADDVMACARKAGAHGGTILNARGTGKKEDVKFFGISIVPEKEILLIVADKSNSEAILNAIREMECFKTPGSGICFSTDVDKFTILGKNVR